MTVLTPVAVAPTTGSTASLDWSLPAKKTESLSVRTAIGSDCRVAPGNLGAALMTNSLHLGAYAGRDAALADHVRGVLCNPMTQAHAFKAAELCLRAQMAARRIA